MAEQPAAPRGEVSLLTVGMPSDVNPSGVMFGGWVMAQLDLAGTHHVHRRCTGRTVTVAATDMVFHQPVLAGDRITCYTETARQGKTSLGVRIELWAHRRREQRDFLAATGTITYVQVDENKKPIPFPQQD